jgi:hypothetical protein
MSYEKSLEKAREIIKNLPSVSSKMEEPDFLPCVICGRIIYCGVNKVCFNMDCPKQDIKTKGKS